MYTLRRAPWGGTSARSRKSRMSSTPLFEAASISNTFSERPCSKARHDSHVRHGSARSRSATGVSQLTAFAMSRAAVVFPTPRGPLRR